MIACLDAHYGEISCRAALVCFDHWSSSTSNSSHAEISFDPAQSYEAGSFYKRELPLLLKLIADLNPLPETILIDAYVWLDASCTKPGLGARLYQAIGERSSVIGIAKSRYISHDGESVGVPVLRGASKRPLFVTAAGITAELAAQNVKSMHGPNRLPTMVKLADNLARGNID